LSKGWASWPQVERQTTGMDEMGQGKR
jgi:hypothetical protein